METFFYILVAVSILYILAIALKQNNFWLFHQNEFETFFNKEEVPSLRKLLNDNFIVYKMLDEKGRKAFEERICRFIKMKNFIAGSNIGEITDEMRVMVAAAAIQITYGYPDVYFNHFQTIILYSEEYYSTITGHYHQGEVNVGGAIVLSWKNFISGFSNLKDGRNLALHEMAHALLLTNIVDNAEYDFIDRDTMLSFESLAVIEMQKIDKEGNTFFRAYGAVNFPEFFSVAVECFFEMPKEFKGYNPELYVLLSRMLKIDLLDFRKD